jgi:16S rRNA C1402 (ribose-2'-O) methylase RsmI
VFYEAPHRIEETVDDLLAVLGGERSILFARELTKKFEQLHACPLADAPAWLAADDNHRRGEFVLVIGPPPAKPTTAMWKRNASWKFCWKNCRSNRRLTSPRASPARAKMPCMNSH